MTDEIYYIDKDLVKQETKEEVEEILSHLNEKDRELFVKHYLEDIDLETIALKSNTKVSNLYIALLHALLICSDHSLAETATPPTKREV